MQTGCHCNCSSKIMKFTETFKLKNLFWFKNCSVCPFTFQINYSSDYFLITSTIYQLQVITIYETKYQSSKLLLSPLGFKILRQLLYVFWNSMEHACINKTSKFETDFLEKKASTIFVASQFLRGTPRYFVFWNFNGIFLYIFPDLHFSMQTHSLVEHIMLCLKSGVSK